jgi:vacuolar-type H+-ATPase subunit I/STV1
MGKLILSLEDDEMSLFKKQYVSLGELQEEIEKLEEEGEKLDKRKKKEYKAWKDKINFLIDVYNTKSKYKTYNKIT